MKALAYFGLVEEGNKLHSKMAQLIRITTQSTVRSVDQQKYMETHEDLLTVFPELGGNKAMLEAEEQWNDVKFFKH